MRKMRIRPLKLSCPKGVAFCNIMTTVHENATIVRSVMQI